MTPEQKAKAYDKALEKARMYRDNAKAVEDYAAAARYENIFPELREEEKPLTPFQQCLNFVLRKVHFASIPGKKENTDKFILDTVKKHTDELVELAKKHECTDCQLHESEDEKIRKNLIRIVQNVRNDSTEKGYYDVSFDKYITWLEKQEQKPISQEDFDTAKHEALWEEQKPAWSKEDEDFINMLILHFNYLIDKGGDSVETYKSYREKLKSLRPQPKQEWSEEDEEMLDAMVDMVSNSLYEPLCSRERMLAWLKSFRPSWKPSEEQLEALNKARRFIPYNCDILESLYEQLKKL